MRKALVIFLLALLPVQFVWGAAAGYCHHEQDRDASHFGHHVHKHHASAGKASDGASDTAEKANAQDADCMACHLSCPILVSVAYDSPQAERITQAVRSVEKTYSRLMVPSIERPKWAVLS